jgi:hypothetical protein
MPFAHLAGCHAHREGTAADEVHANTSQTPGSTNSSVGAVTVDLDTAAAALPDSPFDFEGLPPELQRLHIANSEASEKVPSCHSRGQAASCVLALSEPLARTAVDLHDGGNESLQRCATAPLQQHPPYSTPMANRSVSWANRLSH